jgi:hypothetical protein
MVTATRPASKAETATTLDRIAAALEALVQQRDEAHEREVQAARRLYTVLARRRDEAQYALRNSENVFDLDGAARVELRARLRAAREALDEHEARWGAVLDEVTA